MEKYHPKTTLATILDHVFRVLAAWLAGTAWFISLWGLQLTAFTAGVALGAMVWICVRQFAKHTTQKREQHMRQLIGGELALDRLLLEDSQKAVLHAALWIASRYPIKIEKRSNTYLYGTLEGCPTIVQMIIQHKSMPIHTQQIVECAREFRKQSAELCLLCTTAPVGREAADYAAGLNPPIQIISRDELIRLAGYHSPATDEDLQKLARQKRTRRSLKEWLAVIMDSSRAKRYFWYGTGMGLLALITGSGFYPVPAVLCLGLYGACKINQWRLFSRQAYRHSKG